MGQRIGRSVSKNVLQKSKNVPRQKNDGATAFSPSRLDLKTIKALNRKDEDLVKNMSSIVVDQNENVKTKGVVPTPAPVRSCSTLFVFFLRLTTCGKG